MAKVEFSQEARDDLRSIWHYIAGDNPDAANRVITEVEKASEQLASHPRMGTLRPDYHNLYLWPLPKFRNYLIFYRLKEEDSVVQIVRVLQGSQDLRKSLGGDE
ncbi:MAG: type II toxin-antitoxin system RelE/ParE family toxin [Verrucomicrobiae bacterium]|nr:type II toxin-antitoxin system RelE/ParE family toxin [Verrucomicrobiae bacterium]